MTIAEIQAICLKQQMALLNKYFGNLAHEAAIERPETIGKYTRDLPLKIEAEYRKFLKDMWEKLEFETPLALEERMLRKLKTDDDREMIDYAYEEALERTLAERITKSNHKDVTFYKGLLLEYTRDLLLVMRNDFLEEITSRAITCKYFHDVEVCENIHCDSPMTCPFRDTSFCRFSYAEAD